MIKISVAGDVCPKDRLKNLIAEKKYNTIFGLVKPLLEDSDVSIANFECALTDGQDKPIVKCGPNLSCDENLVDALKWAGFDIFALANNHFADYGASSIQKSIITITSRNCQFVGAGLNIEEAQKSLVINVKGKKMGIINCCEHEFSIATDNKAGCNPLDPINQCEEIEKLQSYVDYVLVIVHGGTEFCPLPSPRMKKLYRFFIDHGADAVVNHHQHCYSGYEIYKGKIIVYGTGNFCFDWNGKRKSSWNEGYIVQIQIEDDGSQHLIMVPYRQCDDEVGVFPMTSTEELNLFHEEIERINGIISDDKKLREEYNFWIDNHENNTRMTLSIYSTRLLRILLKHGLLPAFLTKKRMVLMYNHINCESHQERVLRFIEKRL